MTPLSVLVVDDYPDSARSTAQVLTLLGFRARAAVTPLDAIREAATAPPDAVVLEPGRAGGPDLGRHLRWTGRGRPLMVAFTGAALTGDQVRAAGFDAYVPKPADPTDLAALLRARVGGRPDPFAAATN